MTQEVEQLRQKKIEPEKKATEIINSSGIPFFESKSRPGIFYYFIFGSQVNKESIEKGDALLNYQPVKCLSIKNYDHVQKIPDEIIDDMDLIEESTILSSSQMRNALTQFYHDKASDLPVVVYELTDF